MATFKVPDSAEEAVEQLGSLGRRVDAINRLLSARKWERAAIIACLVGPERGKGRPPSKSLTIETFPFSTVTLSNLGIHGLRSSNTVAHYRNVWCRERPVPDFGDEVDLDGLPEWTGTVRPGHAGTATAVPTPKAEPDEEPVDTEALAVEQARADGTLRLVRDEPESEEPPQTDDVEIRVADDLADDKLHQAVGLLRDARAAFPEDHPVFVRERWRGTRWNKQVAELVDLASDLTAMRVEENQELGT